MYTITLSHVEQLDEHSLSLLLSAGAAIPEFQQFGQDSYGEEHYRQRLQDKPILAQFAYVEGELAGFKLGYALNEHTFYSWLGGVLPEFRQLGLADSLLVQQQDWACTKGYRTIEVKTKNRFAAMLQLLIKHQYQITALAVANVGLDNKITLNKSLTTR
ncbi:GNAT family N-acetyltransferase [Shewanella sp. NIFS-20-20]|uniref:GNAT family N-acetyltransferase n=1 Tax=Shewanella sp. NIFS-20-20 TaxID=2853806 RepID=UPI001C46E44F|nr:GNAT family N-acetyltransferase [Shewanella sp. NIFS-20-20]MBV7316037.1 GNAT family N-acetyltransferase [Shewanella sp. NIFS-20-20]